MHKYTLRAISFGSFIKLIVSIGFSLGIVLGIIFLIAGLLGAPVYVELDTQHIEGPLAAVLGFFLLPVIMSVFGFIGALFSFFPFKYFLRFREGISLNTDIS